MHQTLLLFLALLLAVSILVMIGQRLHIPTPIFLVLSGLLISLMPGISPIEINPELIFLIFLPPLLYQAACHCDESGTLADNGETNLASSSLCWVDRVSYPRKITLAGTY